MEQQKKYPNIKSSDTKNDNEPYYHCWSIKKDNVKCGYVSKTMLNIIQNLPNDQASHR